VKNTNCRWPVAGGRWPVAGSARRARSREIDHGGTGSTGNTGGLLRNKLQFTGSAACPPQAGDFALPEGIRLSGSFALPEEGSDSITPLFPSWRPPAQRLARLWLGTSPCRRDPAQRLARLWLGTSPCRREPAQRELRPTGGRVRLQRPFFRVGAHRLSGLPASGWELRPAGWLGQALIVFGDDVRAWWGRAGESTRIPSHPEFGYLKRGTQYTEA